MAAEVSYPVVAAEKAPELPQAPAPTPEELFALFKDMHRVLKSDPALHAEGKALAKALGRHVRGGPQALQRAFESDAQLRERTEVFTARFAASFKASASSSSSQAVALSRRSFCGFSWWGAVPACESKLAEADRAVFREQLSHVHRYLDGLVA